MALVATSCSSSDPEESPGTATVAGNADGFVERVRTTQHTFSEPYPTPAEMLEASTIAVQGTVETVREGRVLDGGGGLQSSSVVVGIEPIDTVKEDGARRGKLVYFELDRPSNVPIEKYTADLPRGTSVALVGWTFDSTRPAEDPDAGREPGSSVYRPFSQGLWVETSTGFESVLAADAVTQSPWSEITSWEELRSQLLA